MKNNSPSLTLFLEEHYYETVPQFLDALFHPRLINLCPPLLLRNSAPRDTLFIHNHVIDL